MKRTVINGVEVIEDDDGTTHFRPLVQPKDEPKKVEPSKSWWDKLCDWWNDSPVTPYVKVRDMSDPLNQCGEDEDHGIRQTGVEAGIKIKF